MVIPCQQKEWDNHDPCNKSNKQMSQDLFQHKKMRNDKSKAKEKPAKSKAWKQVDLGKS